LHRNFLLPIGFLTEDENSVKPNEINPAPKRQRLRKPRKKPTKPYNNEDTVELETDDETEQEYCVIYRPDEDPQNNTNSDARCVRQRAVIWYIRSVFFCVLTNRFYSYAIITDIIHQYHSCLLKVEHPLQN
jgi:hypothetical protein